MSSRLAFLQLARRPATTRVALTVALLGAVASADAQIAAPLEVPLRPHDEWRTLEIPGFSFHYPAPLEEWTLRQAERMADVQRLVRSLVGYAPTRRVTAVVSDPYNQSNGSAYPFLDAPTVFLWPVPPDPRSVVGDSRDWGELLLVHEFAHLAHLTRPSRNPLRAAAGRFIPAALSPIATGAPRWVYEGYATYVEGRLTGSGRPHGAWRPAVLRQWALDGRLPTYAELNGTGNFFGGSFAYLAGSAYLEWLVARHAAARGDSALAHLWRRMTARSHRGFEAAFAGVFPGTPSELYARWTAELTAEAVAQERRLRAAGIVDGALEQRLSGYTGDPTLSSDGEHLALELRPLGGAPRIVVWRTAPDPPDTARARLAARARRRDPEDVPALPYLPPPKRAVASLPAIDGRAFASPRFLPNGRRLLVVRDEPRPDGAERPDLWVWDSARRRGALRRVTRGAGVRAPDPAPDGRSALAVRCLTGWCDVVRVDLANGAVATVLAGSPDVTYARPRWSPDGRRFVVAEQRAGRWRLVVADVGGGRPLAVGPDDGDDRYDATFLPDGGALVAVSERGGVPNLERVDLTTGAARALTRVTGAALAPAVTADGRTAYFLSLRSGGLDLRRLALDSAASAASAASAVPLLASLPLGVDTAPPERLAAVAVVRRPVEATRAPATAAVPTSRPYGVGPRRYAILPFGSATADGETAAGFLSSADPAGRFSWLLQGAAGDARSWNGGAVSAAWRRFGPAIEGQLFGVAQRVAPPGAPAALLGGAFRDRYRYFGAAVGLTASRQAANAAASARLAASAGRLRADLGQAAPRRVAVAQLGGALTRGRGDGVNTLAVATSVAAGESADSGFRRALGTATLTVRDRSGGVRASYTRGVVNRRAPAFEQFLVGGAEAGLLDPAVVSQRVAMPALPTGFVGGREVETVRIGLTGRLVEPYLWAGRSPGRADGWKRVVGAEVPFAAGAIPFARAPGVRLVAGVGYSRDAPLRRQWRGYVTAAVRP